MIDPFTGWFEITQYNDQKSDDDRKLSRNGVANQVSMANIYHV